MAVPLGHYRFLYGGAGFSRASDSHAAGVPEDFGDYYFLPEGRDTGAVFITERAGEASCCVCYTCYRLHAGTAEPDIWMRSGEWCGKGHGSQALRLLIRHLIESRTKRFLIRPGERNLRAIRSYEKAGFRKVADKVAGIRTCMREPWFGLYRPGDYGWEQTTVMLPER